MSEPIVLTPNEIAEKYIVDCEWSIISLKRKDNALLMTQSGEETFIANCAMWFFKNREDFVKLVNLMNQMQDHQDNLNK